MDWSAGNFENIRRKLEKNFFSDQQKFAASVLEFYRDLGFDKYYAAPGEEFVLAKSTATGVDLARIKTDNATAVKKKLEKAREFSRMFSKFPIAARAKLVEIIAAEVENYAPAFSLIFATDTGKPVQLGAAEISGKGAQWAKWANSAEVLDYLRPILKHKNAEKRAANTPYAAVDIVSLTTRIPHGDVAAIGSYNYLYALVINKLMQSIIAGNGTLIKAGQHGPHWVLLLVDKVIPAAVDNFLSLQKKIPSAKIISLFKEGLCQVVTGRREKDRFLQATFLAFTGSDSGAAAIAAERGIKPAIFEQSGNSPLIICPSFFASKTDADCRKLACDLVAAMNNSGQRCTGPRQIYLLETVEKTNFIKYLNEELKAACQNQHYLGCPYSFETKNGPVVDIKAAATMQELMVAAHRQNLVTIGGKRILADLHPNSFYMQPGAIYYNSASEEPQYREEMRYEIFAPLIQIVQNINLEKAVEFNNRSPQQLAGAIFSADAAEITFVRENINCGSLQVNAMPCDPSPLAPHVDYIGHADGGADSLSKYTRQQVIEGPYTLIKDIADAAFHIFSGTMG